MAPFSIAITSRYFVGVERELLMCIDRLQLASKYL